MVMERMVSIAIQAYERASLESGLRTGHARAFVKHARDLFQVMERVHHGHAVLRKLLPDAAPRRAFVAQACGREVWDAADLICAVNDANRKKKPVNVTPEEAALVRFHFAINVAEEIQRVYPGAPTTDILSMHCGFDDTHKLVPELPKVERAVGVVLEHRSRGKTVLVTCAQGRNRSALVVAEALIREGSDPEFVIRTIRERRANALTNGTFVDWLMRPR